MTVGRFRANRMEGAVFQDRDYLNLEGATKKSEAWLQTSLSFMFEGVCGFKMTLFRFSFENESSICTRYCQSKLANWLR